MPKQYKESMADEVKSQISTSPNILVVGLLQMSAEQNFTLRNQLRDQGARLRVIHNRTSRHALDEARKDLGAFFKGQTALALGDDETEFIVIAKALAETARKDKTIELRAGYVDGELLDTADVALFAKSPDKPTLRAMMLGAINGSARGIAVTLSGVGGGIARCLQARVDKSDEAGGEPEGE